MTSARVLGPDHLLNAIQAKDLFWASTPLWERLLSSMPWWQSNAPHHIVRLLLTGIQADVKLPEKLSVRPPPLKACKGDSTGTRNFEGLSKIWGNKVGAGLGKHQAFSTLVSDFQGGKWGGKTPFDFRLQGTESVLLPKTIQVGKSEPNLALPKTGLVGGKGGLKGRLFPLKNVRKFKTLCQDASGRRTLGVPKRLLWDQHSAIHLHASHESAGLHLEEERVLGFHLPGRHPPPVPHKGTGPKTFGNHGQRFAAGRVQNQLQEKHFGANPKLDTPGNWYKPRAGKAGSPRRKTKKTSERNWGNSSSARLSPAGKWPAF